MQYKERVRLNIMLVNTPRNFLDQTNKDINYTISQVQSAFIKKIVCEQKNKLLIILKVQMGSLLLLFEK